jgi:hypothetical protein
LLAYVARATATSGVSQLVIGPWDRDQNRQTLSCDLSFLSSLRWAPDGRSLVAWGRRGDRYGFWHVDRASGHAVPIVFGGDTTFEQFAGWSADSTKVYTDRQFDATAHALVEHDLPSGAEREIVRATADAEGNPDVARASDGTIYLRRLVAETAGRPPFLVSVLLGRDATTGAERELARGAFSGMLLSPDGRFLAVGRNDREGRQRAIWLVPVDGGEPRELIRTDLPTAYADHVSTLEPMTPYRWSADSRSLVVRKQFGTKNTAERSEWWWVAADAHAAPVELKLGDISELRLSRDNTHIAVTIPGVSANTPAEVRVLGRFMPHPDR